MQATVQDLLGFIRSQPSRRRVNHSSWNSCAVGDYARERLGHEIAVNQGSDYSPVFRDPVLRQLIQESGTCDECTAEKFGVTGDLTESETVMDYLVSPFGRTYGQLVAELKEEGYI